MVLWTTLDQPMLSLELLRRIPKTDLHCHLDGSLRMSTLLELGKAMGIPLPADDVAGLNRAFHIGKGFSSLEEYLAVFPISLAVMQEIHSIERIAEELTLDAAADGVRYLEMRFCPLLHTRRGLQPDRVLEAVLAGAARGEQQTGTVARVIVAAIRSDGASASMQLSELAQAYRDRGVVAFDLAGPEAGFPARDHAAAFASAARAGLPRTVHAGEGDGPASIRQAIADCSAQRIGHGCRLAEDLSLFREVVERGIPLEVCPSSNLHTAVVPSIAAHPLRAQLAGGVRVTINTDNRLVSDTTSSEELARLSAEMGLDDALIFGLIQEGIAAAFAPESLKLSLGAELERAWAAEGLSSL